MVRPMLVAPVGLMSATLAFEMEVAVEGNGSAIFYILAFPIVIGLALFSHSCHEEEQILHISSQLKSKFGPNVQTSNMVHEWSSGLCGEFTRYTFEISSDHYNGPARACCATTTADCDVFW